MNDEQQQTLTKGSYIYLENMNRTNGEGKFSSYVFLNEEKIEHSLVKRILMSSSSLASTKCVSGTKS
ncbi:MAG: hypothetical protein LIP04_15845 [Tannerellaceae bacterium]|nr:hypothetical protein [Tannerellaceae bacterium]